MLFTRNPATGEDKLYGEFLMDAQGEDVVAGEGAGRQEVAAGWKRGRRTLACLLAARWWARLTWRARWHPRAAQPQPRDPRLPSARCARQHAEPLPPTPRPGIRTPVPISEMRAIMPEIYTELHDTVKGLERHMKDMQARGRARFDAMHALGRALPSVAASAAAGGRTGCPPAYVG